MGESSATWIEFYELEDGAADPGVCAGRPRLARPGGLPWGLPHRSGGLAEQFYDLLEKL
jgi:hypothetical protein